VRLPFSVYRRLPHRLPHSLGFSRYSLSFDGIDDYISIPHDASLNYPRTISFWIKKLSDQNSYPRVLSKIVGTTGYRIHWDDVGAGSYLYFCVHWATAGWRTYSFLRLLTLNRWYFAAVTYDGSIVRLYIDGVLQRIVSITDTFTTNNGTLEIGRERDDTYHINAVIDELCFYDQVLSPREIRYNMLNYHSPIMSGIVLLLRMEEGTGLITYDRSGYGNDGSLLPVANRVEGFHRFHTHFYRM